MLKILEKIFLKDPKQDPNPKPCEKSDSDPKKIIPDPQLCLWVITAPTKV
jgi:hypothetical protein